ncbi:phosphotransferase [Microbacterium hatanonis]|uniref:Phosphotransferase n=1 Tax=Microbacterium hatanonis TaxID=404366 RepID=A0A5C8I677_9MICO|nr:phosphotransferase [Microbacterium hatanonis]TXK13403.1 phosphotransferase [Microbacterium hatanonis]
MARSPLTLAASVTAALPGAGVVGVGLLTENGAGRFDSAVARLDDGREVVVRTPADDDSASDLAAESRALHALTPGVRALLPFRVPEVLGEAGSGAARVLVVDRLHGYRVDPAHLPKGSGFATAIGSALAAVHALPPSIVRTDGLPVRTPDQVRDDVSRLLDRAEATRSVPGVLIERWRRAVDSDDLWRFESAVVLGGATSASFLLSEDDTATVTGLLDWGGLSVGDPATDLRWLASAPTAADDVYAGYIADASRAPDALLRERARMYAELEFVKWLVHGHDNGRPEVVADAVALLESLADGVRGDEIVPEASPDVDAALSYAHLIPESAPTAVDTSMQTDAYDPQMMSLFLAAEHDRQTAASAPDFGLDGLREPEEQSTAPIDMEGWSSLRETDAAERETQEESAPAGASARVDDAVNDDEDLRDEAQRATRAALRRWGAGGDDARVGQGS